MEKEIITFCIQQGYLKQDHLDQLQEKQKQLLQQGIKKSLLQLIVEDCNWSKEQLRYISESAIKHGSTQHATHKYLPTQQEIYFIKELIFKGISLKIINDALLKKHPKENIVQAFLKQNVLTPTDISQIKSIMSFSQVDLEQRYKNISTFEIKQQEKGYILHQTNKVREIGNYQVIKEIGRGGMGVVYLAKDKNLGRDVALKTLKVNDFSDELELERFQREAELTASLNHSGIITIHEVGVHENTPFFAMEYIEGESLKEYVEKSNLSFFELAELLYEIADILSFAHKKNIIHRDLKPSNILIDSEGKPHLADFGLARNIKVDNNLTASGTTIGTPAYMSPEQVQGKNRNINKTSDIYSFGVLMYEVFCGRVPFRGSSFNAMRIAILEKEPEFPLEVKKELPWELETICLKCLEKEQSRRYANGKFLAADFQRYINGETILARPASMVYKTKKWISRNKFMTTLGCSLFFLTSFLVYWFFGAPGSLTLKTYVRINKKRVPVLCKIKINGKRIGKKTFSLSPGYHKVQLSLKNYRSLNFLVKINSNEKRKLEKELIHQKGSLTILSSLAEIKVTLINKKTKEKKKLLAPFYNYLIDTGQYQVLFQKANHFPLQKTISIQKDTTSELQVKLEKMLLWHNSILRKDSITDMKIADLDFNGSLELILASEKGIFVYDLESREKLWEIKKPSRWLQIEDINRDGYLDILSNNRQLFMAIDSKTHTPFSLYPEWWGNIFTTYDINGDKVKDLILFSEYLGLTYYDVLSSKIIWRKSYNTPGTACKPLIINNFAIYGAKGKIYKLHMKSGVLSQLYSYGNLSCSNIIQIRNPRTKRINLIWHAPKQGIFCIDYKTGKKYGFIKKNTTKDMSLVTILIMMGKRNSLYISINSTALIHI